MKLINDQVVAFAGGAANGAALIHDREFATAVDQHFDPGLIVIALVRERIVVAAVRHLRDCAEAVVVRIQIGGVKKFRVERECLKCVFLRRRLIRGINR